MKDEATWGTTDRAPNMKRRNKKGRPESTGKEQNRESLYSSSSTTVVVALSQEAINRLSLTFLL